MFVSPNSSFDILEYSDNWSYISKTRYLRWDNWKPKQFDQQFGKAGMERVAWYQTWFITASLEVKQEDILGFWLIFLHLIISLLWK